MLRKYITIIKILFINNIKYHAQYKINLLVKFISEGIELWVAIIFFSLIFRHTHRISHWRYHELLILIFTFDFMRSLLNGLFVKNLSKIEDILVNGKFDYYLTKPVDVQFYTSIQQVSLPHFMHALVPFVLLVIVLFKYNVSCSITSILGFMICLVLGLLATYSSWILIMSSCFYITKIKAIHEVFLELIQLGKYPKDIYSKFLQMVLTTITPVLLIASYPVEALLKTDICAYLSIIAPVAISIFIISRYVWNYSVQKYESAGG